MTAIWKTRRHVGLSALLGIALVVGMAAIGSASPDHAVGGSYGKTDHARRGTCTSGQVLLGARPGVIKFFAHCRAPATGGKVGLDLLRSSIHGAHRGPGILKFSRRPSLSGEGARGRYGVCLLRNKVLGCHARANGQVRLSGSIWVRKGQRCTMRVTLEAIKPPPCNQEGECLAVLEVKVLAKGRPQGC